MPLDATDLSGVQWLLPYRQMGQQLLANTGRLARTMNESAAQSTVPLAGEVPPTGVALPGAAELRLVGLGIGGLHRLTAEAVSHLSEATEILHISPLHPALARRFGAERVRSLYHLYQEEGRPSDTYRRMAQMAIESAIQASATGGYACLAVYGHPLWLVKPSRIAMELAREHSVAVKVIAGLSSFDTLLIDAPIELDWGIQMLDASQFVRRKLVVDTRIPLLLFQAGVFGIATANSDFKDLKRFDPLVDRLNVLYGADHPVYTIMSGWGDKLPTMIQLAVVADFVHRTDVHGSTTIIVPPVSAEE